MFSSSFDKSFIGAFFKRNLDSRRSTVFCLFLAFLNKMSIAWLYLSLEGDKSLYLLFSQSLIKGKALLEPVKLIHNSDTEYVYNPAIFSPLYSIISAPFLYLTDSFVATSILMDTIAWSSFILGLYKVARLILIERWIANLFILTAGFFLYPHELASTPKDTLAVGLILWSCYFTYKVIKSTRLQLFLVISLSCFYLLFALTKYLYSPLVLVFLFILFIYAVIKKRRHRFFHALIPLGMLLVSFILFSHFITSQKQLFSSSSLNSDGSTFIRGLYPENLFYTFPFITSSFINTNFWGVQLERLLHIPFSSVSLWFQWIDLLVIGLALFLFILVMKKITKLPVLFLILGAISVAIFFMVCYMSLTHKAQYTESGPGYTYVMEARSFLFIMLVLQLLAFHIVFRSEVRLGYQLLLFSFFLFESLHGAYFTGKQLLNRDAVLAQQRVDSPNKRIISRLTRLEQGEQWPALVTTDNLLRRLALVNGLEASSLPKVCRTRIETRVPALIAIPQRDTVALKTCLPANQSYLQDSIPPYILFWLQEVN